VRDLVWCRSTFQREILTARHYVLKFLARRGLLYREGTPWRRPHYEWLRRLARAASPLAAEDRIVFGEYLALLEYKLSRRDELDRQIAALALTPALTPALAPKVARLQCFRGLDMHRAMVLATELADWRRVGSAREFMDCFRLVAHAWKAQHRAHKVFRRSSAARPPQVAVVAVAPREAGGSGPILCRSRLKFLSRDDGILDG